jgi:eukaryotic-like serine/threonine-protein kinase
VSCAPDDRSVPYGTLTPARLPVIQLQTLGRVRLVGDRPAEDQSPAASQPKRLALLAYLALMSSRAPVRRDLLLALFWPELGDDEARRALRQALHYLRRVLGEDVLVGAGEELAVSGQRFRCDAVEFERLVGAGQPASALSLYQGDFLAGFHVPDVSAELEEWVERTRTRLRRQAAAAAWSAAEAAESGGQGEAALELARRGCELEPDQETGWRRVMLLQHRLNDRAGALRTYDELAARLRREFEAEPSAETAALAASLRAPRPSNEVVASSTPTLAPSDVSAAVLPDAATSPRATPTRPERKWIPAAVVGALLVFAGAFVWLRLSAENRAEPSLLHTGVLAPRDRLLIADFRDTGGDTALAIAITEAFRVDLTQSPNVQVLTPRQVGSALERLERSADLAVNDSLAREIALREAVKAFVVGRISNIAGSWTLTVELVGAESGDVLAAVRETASDSTDLIGAVDRASERLRYRLGESLRALRALPPLSKQMTASLPALRKYTEAGRLQAGTERTRALPLLQQAIELDSSFATAHLAMANAYQALGEPGRSSESFRRALAHLDRLPYRDRQFLVATRAYGREEWDTAIEAYTRYLERYPDYVPALNNLALVYRDARRLAPAETLWARAVKLDSTMAALYFGVHSVQLLAGRFRDSRRTLDLIGRRFPDKSLLLGIEVQDAAAQQDWEGAERRAEANIAALQQDTLALVDGFEQMAGIVMTQGRLVEAERYWRTQLELAARSQSWGRRLVGALQLGYLQLRYRKAPKAAIAIVDSALAFHPLDRTLPGDRPYYELARFFAAAGEVARARRLVAEAWVNDSVLDVPRTTDRAWTAGVIALAEGRAVEAEAALREAAERHVCAICPLPDLARAYEASGNRSGAIEAYERYLTTPWFYRYEDDARELGFVLERLGTLYESQGDRRHAEEMRTRLLTLWRRADAELQPVLVDLRTRMTAPPR